MEDRKQPFATFVFETLTRQSTELAQRWTRHARRVAAHSGELAGEGDAAESARDGAEPLIRTLLAAAANGTLRHESLREAGTAMGADAHRRNVSLQLMLEEVDLLGTLMLRCAEDVAAEYPAHATGQEGLAVARRIAGVTSQLRVAATRGYALAIEGELRERYRVIRHDLRNPLGTIKSAVALLTDNSVPAEMRESAQVRAMVARNTSSLDQMIGEALGDDAARLRAFETSREASLDISSETTTDPSADPPSASTRSGREQSDDLARARQRPDLESGAF